MEIKTDVNGYVSIAPKMQDFGWKTYGENASANINSGIEIRYTINGETPGRNAKLYTEPWLLEKGTLRAAAFSKTETGSTAIANIGIPKKDWTLIAASSERKPHSATNAFDADAKTFWSSDNTGAAQEIIIDLGRNYVLRGFAYTPQTLNKEGMMQKGIISVSEDGKNWKEAAGFQFGNLINDPVKRDFFFQQRMTGRFVKIASLEIAANGNNLAIAELDFYE